MRQLPRLDVTRRIKVIDAWFMLGNELPQTAVRAGHRSYKQALALKSDYDLVVINMANAIVSSAGRGGWWATAGSWSSIRGTRRSATRLPRSSSTAATSQARAELQEALKLQPSMAAARNALGIVALKTGDVPGAEKEIRSAIVLKSDVRLAHFNLALLAEQRGDLGAAIDEYKREIQLYPASYKAQFNLGRLYEQVGDVPAQLEAYKKAIDTNPNFARDTCSWPALSDRSEAGRGVRLAQKVTARADVRVRPSGITSLPTYTRVRDARPIPCARRHSGVHSKRESSSVRRRRVPCDKRGRARSDVALKRFAS
jgi:hypothetical protein